MRMETFHGLHLYKPWYHSHLVKCAVTLVPHPVLIVKNMMFVYILQLLNRKGNLALFELQNSGCKANNAQKEKRYHRIRAMFPSMRGNVKR